MADGRPFHEVVSEFLDQLDDDEREEGGEWLAAIDELIAEHDAAREAETKAAAEAETVQPEPADPPADPPATQSGVFSHG